MENGKDNRTTVINHMSWPKLLRIRFSVVLSDIFVVFFRFIFMLFAPSEFLSILHTIMFMTQPFEEEKNHSHTKIRQK